MRISPPKLVIYGRSAEEAVDVIWRRRLRHTEVFCGPILGLLFTNANDLLLFAIGLNCEIIREDCLAIIPPAREKKARDFINDIMLGERVETVELLGIWFYDTEDQEVVDREFGFVNEPQATSEG
jgi:hypothetical protein